MRNALVFFVSAMLLFAGGSAWLALYPAVPADLGGVENLDRHARHVRIPVGEDDHLDGWHLPGSKNATVILFAGYARDHRRMWRYGHFLRRDGYGVLAVDFRSARAFRRKPTTLGLHELHDARAALDWVRSQPELRGHRVSLYGESLGGAVALALAAERPDVSAVVADCPFASGDAAINDGFRYVAHLPEYPLGPIARQMGRLFTGHDPGSLDATAALRALSGRPVLLIQTRAEDRFSNREVDRLTTAAGLDAETWTVDDAKHNQVWIRHRDEYERRVSRFLAARSGGGPWAAQPKPGPGSRALKGVQAGGRAVAKGAAAGARAVGEGAKRVGRAVASPLKKSGS